MVLTEFEHGESTVERYRGLYLREVSENGTKSSARLEKDTSKRFHEHLSTIADFRFQRAQTDFLR